MQSTDLQFKIKSQKGLILKEMENHPTRWFTVAYFCGQHDHCFVGYKASARICELQTSGYLISRWCEDRRTALGGKIKEYRLSPNYRLEFESDQIKIVEKTPEEAQSSLF